MIATEIIDGKFYEVDRDPETGNFLDLPRLIVPEPPKPTSITLDEPATSELFLQYADEIEAWLAVSKRPNILRAILNRQGSVMTKEVIARIHQLINNEIVDGSLDKDSALVLEFDQRLSQVLDKLA